MWGLRGWGTLSHIVTYKQHRSAIPGHLVHLAQTFFSKFRIAHRQHFIDDQNAGSEQRTLHVRFEPTQLLGLLQHHHVDPVAELGAQQALGHREAALGRGQGDDEPELEQQPLLAARPIRARADRWSAA